jgi:hypothetical protein
MSFGLMKKMVLVPALAGMPAGGQPCANLAISSTQLRSQRSFRALQEFLVLSKLAGIGMDRGEDLLLNLGQVDDGWGRGSNQLKLRW